MVEASIANASRSIDKYECLTDKDRCVHAFFRMLEKVESREKEVIERESKVEELFKEFKFKENEVIERELKVEELKLREKEVTERELKVELREKDVIERESKVEVLFKEFKLKENEVIERELKVDDRFKELELKKNEVTERELKVDDRFKELELKKNEVIERELKVDDRFKELKVKENEVNEGFVSLHNEQELKRKEFVESRRLLELQKKSLNEKSKTLDKKEMETIESCKEVELMKEEVELSKKEFSESFRGLQLKENQVNERFNRVKMAEEDVEGRLLAVRLKEEDFIKGVQKFELNEKKLNEREKDMDECYEALTLREKEVDQESRELESKGKEIDESRKEVDLLKEEVDQRCLEVQKKDEELNDKLREVNLKEKEVEERIRGVELREKELGERFLELDLKEKEIKLLENEVSERFQELGLKERELDECQKLVVLGRKQLNDSFEACVLKVKKMEDCCAMIELQYDEAAKVIEKQLNEDLEALGTKVQEIEEVCRLMELMKKEIDDNLDMVEVKEKQIRRRNKVLDWKLQWTNERCDTQLSKENIVDERTQSLEEKEKQFSERCTAFELKEKQLSVGLQDLELKQSQINEEYRMLELKKMKSNDNYEAELNEKQIRSNRTLEWSEELIDEYLQALNNEQCEIDRPAVVPGLSLRCGVSETEKGCSAEAEVGIGEPYPESLSVNDLQKLCARMNANGVRSYLIEHDKEYDELGNKILDSLQSVSDPAKLVLDVIQSFHKKELEKVLVQNVTASCIFLLVQFMKLGAHISSFVEGEARKFVDTWRLLLKQDNTAFSCSKKRKKIKDNIALENFGFLLFLASFNLVDDYDLDEILSPFVTFFDDVLVYQPEQYPLLLHALELTKKIPVLIQSLISRDKHLLAVSYICSLKMVDAFPLAPIFDAYLKNIQKRGKDIVEQGSGTAEGDAVNMELTALKKAVNMELTALKKIENCIYKYKLQSRYSLLALKSRREMLVKKGCSIRKSNNEQPNEQLKKVLNENKTDPHPLGMEICSSMKRDVAKKIAETNNPQALNSDAQSQKKRHATAGLSLHKKRRIVVGDHQKLFLSYPNPSSVQPTPLYQRHLLPRQNLPAASHLGVSRSSCDVPYNMHTSMLGGFTNQPFGAPTFVYDARRPAYMAEQYNGYGR